MISIRNRIGELIFLSLIDRTVTLEEGEKKAKELNVMFIETSAKAGHNVSATTTGNFQHISNMMFFWSR